LKESGYRVHRLPEASHSMNWELPEAFSRNVEITSAKIKNNREDEISEIRDPLKSRRSEAMDWNDWNGSLT
jgi:hypothetical protein